VDGVLCTRNLLLSDCLEISRQIRRVLKPGGRAAFVQRIASVKWFSKWMRVPLTHLHIEQISRAVGRHGRQREFASSLLLTSLAVWEARKEC
jgi:hypothetical protein